MRRLSSVALAVILFVAPASAQFGPTPGGGGGGGGGAGVSSFASTCPTIGAATGAVVLSNGIHETTQSSAYTILASDCGSVIKATAAITLPTPAAGFNVAVMNGNATGGASITVTASSGQIFSSGVLASSVSLTPGQTMAYVANATPGWDGSTGPAGPTGATGAAGAAGLIGPGYAAGPFYNPFNTLGGGPGASVAAITTTYCSVLYFPNINPAGGGTGTLGSLGTRVATVGTTTFQMGLYANDNTITPNRPGALVGSTTAVANTTGVTGVLPFATGVSVSANTLYWVCLQSGDTTMSYTAEPTTAGGPFTQFVGGSSALVVGSTGNPAYQGVSFPVGTYGNWPSTAHGLTFTEITGHSPWFFFTFASIP